MPAEPVPLSGKVRAFEVAKTWRSRSLVSSRSCRNWGSRCPSTGPASAMVTSGYGFEGPGPMSRRSEIPTGASWQVGAHLRQRARRSVRRPVDCLRGKGALRSTGAPPLPPDVSQDPAAYDAWVRDREGQPGISRRPPREEGAEPGLMMLAADAPARHARTLRSLHAQTTDRWSLTVPLSGVRLAEHSGADRSPIIGLPTHQAPHPGPHGHPRMACRAVTSSRKASRRPRRRGARISSSRVMSGRRDAVALAQYAPCTTRSVVYADEDTHQRRRRTRAPAARSRTSRQTSSCASAVRRAPACDRLRPPPRLDAALRCGGQCPGARMRSSCLRGGRTGHAHRRSLVPSHRR